jgi:hypothetical protein
MLDGLPVTGFGTIFGGVAVTSISGGANVTTIEALAFRSCTALTSVSLPNATTIGYQAFRSCTALTSVSLPNATTIGDSAFRSCTALTSVSLPNATTIGNFAFADCSALTSVSLPNATTIGNFAFRSCTALTSVSLPNATTIGNGAFSYCTALTSVSLPNATTIGNGAFYECTALTSVSFGQNAPAAAIDVYINTPSVTNYVTNPTATGWGATWNGRPVVRLPVYADTFYGSGSGLTDITIAGVTGLQGALDGKLGTDATPASIGAMATTERVYAPTLTISTAAGITNTIAINPTNRIYKLTVTNLTSVLAFDLTGLAIGTQVADWETFITIATTNVSFAYPATNANTRYISTPTVSTTTSNQTLFASWRYWVRPNGATNLICNQWDSY